MPCRCAIAFAMNAHSHKMKCWSRPSGAKFYARGARLLDGTIDCRIAHSEPARNRDDGHGLQVFHRQHERGLARGQRSVFHAQQIRAGETELPGHGLKHLVKRPAQKGIYLREFIRERRRACPSPSRWERDQG